MAASYSFLIDWDGDGGQTAIGSFENTVGTDNWLPGGTLPPSLSRSTTRSHSGDASLLVTWQTGGFLPLFGQIRTHKLITGNVYTWSAWVWVPSGGAPGVCLTVAGTAAFGTGSTLFDQWQQLTYTFTAIDDYADFQVWPTSAPVAGEQLWFDEPTVYIAGEDVSSRVLERGTVSVQYGRDQSRNLSPIAPGRAEFVVDNRSRDYSPENSSSPLAGYVLPARPVVIKATLNSKSYTLLAGNLDDFEVMPDVSNRSVSFTAVDMLAKFRDVRVSVELTHGVRTGAAIGLVLDQMGWPAAARDIDPGASTIQWFWLEREDGLTALQDIVNTEGPGALSYVSGDGRFVFRDRHHRLLRAESTTSQATFRDTGAEPKFSAPLVYDHGWRDIVNSVTIAVEERAPDPVLSNVFSSDRTYAISDGQTLVIRAEASEPFYDAVTPVAGTDYTLLSGAVTVTMSGTKGQSTTVYVKATGGPAVLAELRVRAYSVGVARTIQVHAEDSVSIQRYGRRSYTADASWIGVNDAEAVAELILAQRAERLPIVSLRVVGSNDTRLTQCLARKLSDCITIVDAETGLSDEFYIERVEHTISGAGLYHETVFGCEKVPSVPTGVFRFDDAALGFDDGVFGSVGLDDPDLIFLFDDAAKGFNDGVFAH